MKKGGMTTAFLVYNPLCQRTKIGSMPCDCWATAFNDPISLAFYFLQAREAAVSGFFCV
jgi:hypothetical protein